MDANESEGERKDTSAESTKPTCFICRDDSGSSHKEETRSVCSCTLVAHDECFRTWFTLRSSIACPQCRRAFRFTPGTRSSILESIDNLFARWPPQAYTTWRTPVITTVFSMTCCSSGIYTLGTIHNAFVARMLLGGDMFDLLFGFDPLEWGFDTIWRLICWDSGLMFVFSMLRLVSFWPVPPLISRVRILRTPSRLREASLTALPSTAPGWWPPSATHTYLVLWPIVSELYHLLYDRILRLLFGASQYPFKLNGRLRLGLGYIRFCYNVAFPRGPAAENIRSAVRAAIQEPHDIPQGSNGDVIVQASESMVNQADAMFEFDVVAPVMAALFGWALSTLPRWFPALEGALGVGPRLAEIGVLPGLKVEDDEYWRRYADWAFVNSDHVWLRNLMGLGIWTVLRDISVLIYRWMRQRERATRVLIVPPVVAKVEPDKPELKPEIHEVHHDASAATATEAPGVAPAIEGISA